MLSPLLFLAAAKVPITKGGIGMAAASAAPKSTTQADDSEGEDLVVDEDLEWGKGEETVKEVTKEETEVEKLIREEEGGIAEMVKIIEAKRLKLEAFKKARYEEEPAPHDAHDGNTSGSGSDSSGDVPLGTDAYDHSAAIQLSSGGGSIPPSSSASDTAAAAAEAAAKHNRLLAAANAEAEAAVAVAEKAAAVKAQAAERQAAEKAAAEVAQVAEDARLRAAAEAAAAESIKLQAHAATATQTPPPTATVPVRPKEVRFTVNTDTGQLPTWAEMMEQNKHIPAELMEQNKHMFEKHILDACKFAFIFSVLLKGLTKIFSPAVGPTLAQVHPAFGSETAEYPSLPRALTFTSMIKPYFTLRAVAGNPKGPPTTNTYKYTPSHVKRGIVPEETGPQRKAAFKLKPDDLKELVKTADDLSAVMEAIEQHQKHAMDVHTGLNTFNSRVQRLELQRLQI